MLLKNRVAIITGAASPRGIGKAMAQVFAEHGARIAILDLNEEAAAAAAKDIGPDHVGLACDVTNKEDCERAAQAVLQRLGQIDVLVNNAGITQPLKFMEIQPENYEAVTRCQSARHALHEPGGGSRTCASSKRGLDRLHVVGVRPARRRHLRRPALFSAAKAGVLGLAKAMAREFGPGRHPRQFGHPRPDPDRYHRRQADRRHEDGDPKGIPLNRLGDAEMSRAPVFFLPPTSPPTSPAPRSTSTAAC